MGGCDLIVQAQVWRGFVFEGKGQQMDGGKRGCWVAGCLTMTGAVSFSGRANCLRCSWEDFICERKKEKTMKGRSMKEKTPLIKNIYHPRSL